MLRVTVTPVGPLLPEEEAPREEVAGGVCGQRRGASSRGPAVSRGWGKWGPEAGQGMEHRPYRGQGPPRGGEGRGTASVLKRPRPLPPSAQGFVPSPAGLW